MTRMGTTRCANMRMHRSFIHDPGTRLKPFPLFLSRSWKEVWSCVGTSLTSSGWHHWGWLPASRFHWQGQGVSKATALGTFILESKCFLERP
jgi:hypothetical protein